MSTKAKMKKIHKAYYIKEDRKYSKIFAACDGFWPIAFKTDLSKPYFLSAQWKNVNCKKCLKKQKI